MSSVSRYRKFKRSLITIYKNGEDSLSLMSLAEADKKGKKSTELRLSSAARISLTRR